MEELQYKPNIGFIKTQIGYLRNHNSNSPLMESFEKMADNKVDFFKVCELLHTNYEDLNEVFSNAPIGELTLKIFKVINNDFALAKSPNGTIVAISTKDCLWQQQSKHYYGAGKKPRFAIVFFTGIHYYEADFLLMVSALAFIRPRTLTVTTICPEQVQSLLGTCWLNL